MSTFLFYKPNSNPNRYSRSERFSAHHTVLNLDNSLNHRRSPSPKGSALSEDVHSNDDNGHRLNTHQAATGRSVYMRADSILSSGMSDSCGESIQDDIESLHSLFSEPATGSQSDFSEADGVASAGGVLTRSIEDVFPTGPCDDERASMENTLQVIHSNRPSPNMNCYHQRSKGDSPPGANSEASEFTCKSVNFGNVAHCSRPQPMDTPLEGSFTFCTPTQSPSRSTILEKRRSSSVLKTQGLKPPEHTSNYGEMLSGKDYPEPQVGSFHPDDKTDVPCCTSFAPDAPKCLGSGVAPPLSDEHGLQPDTCTGAPSPARLGSPQLLHSLRGLAEEPLSNPRHSDVHYPVIPDCVGAIGPDTVPMDCAINLNELESCPPASSPREFDVHIQDPLQHPGAEPKDLEVLLAAVPSDGLGPDVQYQTRQELGVNRDGNSVVPVHATGLRSKDPHVAPKTPNSVSLRPCPEGYLEFSHVEIRNHRPLENTTSSIKTLENITNHPSSSCCHFKETSRAWCLDRSILSINIQNADFPIGLGKSSFHVFEDQVIQILTVVHGPVEAFLSQKTAPSTKVNKKKQKFSHPAAAAAPLSSEQKQYLLELRDQGPYME